VISRIVAHLDFDVPRVAALDPALWEHQEPHVALEAGETTRESSGCRGPGGKAEALNQVERVNEADPPRVEARLPGDTCHLDANQVVRDGDAGNLLANASEGAAYWRVPRRP
jgi:hypothetical protein